MSSFQEIKTLFTNEIINSPQYAVAMKIKDLIIADIQAPNIGFTFIYEFKDSDYKDLNNKDYEERVIVFALKLILGIDAELFNNGMNRGIVIVMKKFLD
jgi:hypothetical protein